MGTSWLDGRMRLKSADVFTGIKYPMLHVLLINAAIIYDTALSEELVLLRDGWDEFTSARPYLQVSAVLYLS